MMVPSLETTRPDRVAETIWAVGETALVRVLIGVLLFSGDERRVAWATHLSHQRRRHVCAAHDARATREKVVLSLAGLVGTDRTADPNPSADGYRATDERNRPEDRERFSNQGLTKRGRPAVRTHDAQPERSLAERGSEKRI